MFAKVLVANRGEIAVRVMRTLRELGIGSVAVFSEVDRAALHVRMADEAYCIGPAESSESYLQAGRLIDVARQSGAEALHPGYGFLSESAELASACVNANVRFIGPPAAAIRAMGDKTEARRRMEAAGVPVVPGAQLDGDASHSNAGQQTGTSLGAQAEQLGFPVLLKAAAGGGGKGMRRVDAAHELEGALIRAQSEALRAFGDATVYMEKLIDRARHVEVQLLADQHGNCVHLFERDCSVQRRHQKIIEESPAPNLSPATRTAMAEVAVRAAQAVQYESAGTVEFLVSPDESFYFLEMNTRLQVEHAITEWVTGVDLVREQVRVAAGLALGSAQSDMHSLGHAIECRVYAEDPEHGFAPSPGQIEVLRLPDGPGVRVDTGVYAGAQVSMFYDPLIAKLSVWAADREQARRRALRALHEFRVTGIETNLSFLRSVLASPTFEAGDCDTGFVERELEVLQRPTPMADADGVALSIGAALSQASKVTRPQRGARLSPWKTARK